MNNAVIKDVYLKSPDLSNECIIGYNVGVRPFRKTGVRLEVENTGNKMLIHNYGYGGSGLTLSWGSAQQVMQMIKREKIAGKRIAVLGAGVIGMTCAYELLAQGHQVILYADKFTPALTSNVAAGIFSYPVLQGGESAEQKELLARLFEISAERYQSLLKTPEFAGIQIVNDYIFEENAETHHALVNEYGSVALEKVKVMVHFNNGLIKPATCNRVFGLDGNLYINDLFSKVKSKGGVIQQKYFRNKKEIEELPEDIVINSTSLGSRELFDDGDFIPTRGHLIYFKPQPGVDYSTYENTPDPAYWVKIYPWHDRLILNGVYEQWQEKCEIDQRVIKALLEHARACFSLAKL